MLLKRPITAFMIILATLIFGGVALSSLSVNLLPEIDSPELLIRTDWSGAAPREVEQRINEPLEGLMSTIPGIESVKGFARQGQSIVSLRFKWGHNMDLAFLNVREKLDQVRFSLPQEAERPQLIHSSASDEPVAVLGVTSKTQPQPDFETRLALKQWAGQVLARRLEQADGIAQVVLVGEVKPQVQVRYRPGELSRYGLSLSQVQNLVSQANLFTPAGELRDGWYRYSIKIQSRIESLEDIRSVPLTTLGTGKILKLSDVADIQMQEADPSSFAMVDGDRVLTVLVKKEYGANTVTVYDTMQPLLDELAAQAPDVEVQVLRENANFIRNTISNLLQTLVYGAVLAFIILFFFLDDLRTPFTIGIAIPVSIFLTFFVMFIFDIQLNIVSLSGLTLAIGLLLDNAIIVLENINRHRGPGMPILEAASTGTKEIALAVSASTFTTISVFLPLVFIGGFEGAFFEDQALTLSISLLASLMVALLILPVLVVQVQKSRQGEGAGTNFSGYFNRVRDRYEKSLQWALQRKGRFVLGTLLLMAGTVYLFMQVDKSVLPETEPQEVRYRVRLPGNTSLQSTREAAMALDMHLLNNVSGISGIQELGGYTDESDLTGMSEEGLNKFMVSVPVNGFEQAADVRRQVDVFMDGRPGWSAEPLSERSAMNVLPDAGLPPVIFRMVGTDRQTSEQYMAELQQRLATASGRESLQLTKLYDQTVRTYQITFHKDRLLRLGASEDEVIRYLESFTRGSWITDWNRQDENVAIRLVGLGRRLYEPGQVTLELDGKHIPLNYLAEITQQSEPEQLERVNQAPVLSYVAEMSFADWWWSRDRVEEELVQFARDTGIEVQVGGSVVNMIDLLGQMGTLLLISVIIIYIILAVQFENLKYPWIILVAVPFAWVGSVLILFLTGSSLNALSFMGVLILTGIAVNDSILKVDFMRRYYLDTGKLDEAVTLAGLHRFRPVVMTSLTTIFGLIPMLIPFGDGYAFRQSLALALMGGMVTSTLLTLYLVPIIFQWVESWRAAPAESN